jgi:virulence-associated protein VapD
VNDALARVALIADDGTTTAEGITMAVAAREARSGSMRHGMPAPFKKEGVVYAIAFDMDIEQLQVHYGDPYNNAYLEIRRVLEAHQFAWQQGSMYFGGPAVTAASVMVAVIDLTAQLPWFAASVRDIRMLRIEELNDLMPVVQRVAEALP